MQSESKEPLLNEKLSVILIFLIGFVIISLILSRNFFFQSTYILKNFGELSVEPEIAFQNDKPTFLEFYAEWCEVCKEMAPKVSNLMNDYKNDVNFVFLNVDNPKWVNYVKDFNVNGIPQVNLLNNKGTVEATFIGKQDEKIYKEFLENLNNSVSSKQKILISETTPLKENAVIPVGPRSHG